MLVQKTDGSFAPRETNFIALGYVFIRGVAAPHYALALGTTTNERRRFSFASFNFTADHTTDELTATDHGLELGDGPVQLTGSDLPDGLATLTDYWIIKVDDDIFQLAASLDDAYDGTFVEFDDNGTPTHTITPKTVEGNVLCQRGLDGHFTYEATQGETAHDTPETTIIIDGGGGTDYDRDVGSGSWVSVDMSNAGSSVWDEVMENGNTYGDGVRVLVRGEAANYSRDVDGKHIIRDLADTKDSHEGTITASGRSDASILDPT